MKRSKIGSQELESLGNIPKSYANPQRAVRFEGYVIPRKENQDPKAIFKFYDMVIRGEKTPRELVVDAKKFLENEVNKKVILPHLGMGFAILSRNTLNAALWDKSEPIVPVNYLYEFEHNNFNTATKVDINKKGAFCMWELEIVNHEKEAWKKYFYSDRKNIYKLAWTTDTIQGDL